MEPLTLNLAIFYELMALFAEILGHYLMTFITFYDTIYSIHWSLEILS